MEENKKGVKLEKKCRNFTQKTKRNQNPKSLMRRETLCGMSKVLSQMQIRREI